MDEMSLLDNTLVVMVSDHGDMLGQHGLSQKMCPYEEALRIPCTMSWRGALQPGTRCGMDASLVDMAPTIIAAAGHDIEKIDMEGENLLPYIAGDRPEPEHRDCFSQYNLSRFQQKFHGIQNWRCIVRRPWKYVLHENGETEMFNQQEDPSEIRNLAGTPQVSSLESELQNALLAWTRRTRDPFRANLIK